MGISTMLQLVITLAQAELARTLNEGGLTLTLTPNPNPNPSTNPSPNPNPDPRPSWRAR
jgi:hypothetical protein